MPRFPTRNLTCLVAIGAGLAITVIGAGSPVAQNFGNPQRGSVLARDVCAECHAVVPGQRSKNEAAPTFEVVAKTSGMVGLALEAALNTAHRQMPNIMLSAPDRADIIAYIESLRDNK